MLAIYVKPFWACVQCGAVRLLDPLGRCGGCALKERKPRRRDP